MGYVLLCREESAEGYPLRGDEGIMKKKKHGTSEKPVMQNLRYGCDPKVLALTTQPRTGRSLRLFRPRCMRQHLH